MQTNIFRNKCVFDFIAFVRYGYETALHCTLVHTQDAIVLLDFRNHKIIIPFYFEFLHRDVQQCE